MDWNLLGLSFITVFLAELGDKSQLAAIALSGTTKSPKAVFFGSVAALILASPLTEEPWSLSVMTGLPWATTV